MITLSAVTKSVLLVISCIIIAGCGPALRVYSEPMGANIHLNGTDTGLKTPDKIRLADLPVGISYITVEKAGYKTTTPKQFADVSVSVGNIIWSVLWPPVIIKNLSSNYWKSLDSPIDEQLQTFQLEKIAEVSQSNSVNMPVLTPTVGQTTP